MVETRLTRVLLRLGAGATLAFIYLPLVVIGIYAFNENISQTWPIESYTTKWFSVAWHDEDVRDALKLSVEAALGATTIALVLGTLAAIASPAPRSSDARRSRSSSSFRSRFRGSSPASRSRRRS